MINYEVAPHVICNNSPVEHFLIPWLVFEIWPTEDEVREKEDFSRNLNIKVMKLIGLIYEQYTKSSILNSIWLPHKILFFLYLIFCRSYLKNQPWNQKVLNWRVVTNYMRSNFVVDHFSWKCLLQKLGLSLWRVLPERRFVFKSEGFVSRVKLTLNLERRVLYFRPHNVT
jgi:hypothetical protein